MPFGPGGYPSGHEARVPLSAFEPVTHRPNVVAVDGRPDPVWRTAGNSLDRTRLHHQYRAWAVWARRKPARPPQVLGGDQHSVGAPSDGDVTLVPRGFRRHVS